MKYLLDTHIFIWWVLDNPKLSENNKAAIANTKI
jgi:PIN domain nuclease of toxin-antitoxin system